MSEHQFDPARAEALERALGELPQRARAHRGVSRGGPEPRRVVVVRRVATVVVAVAVLVGVVAVLQTVQHRSPVGGSNPVPAPVSTPAPTITVGGVVLRYAGVVPWRDAIRATEDSRTVTIAGDGDQVHGAGFVCNGADAQRVQVRETAAHIEILVLGYTAQAKFAGGDCFGVGHPTTAHTVHLAAPVGSRTIVDLSNGTEHSILTDADVPKATQVPSGFIDLGASWDDRFPGVTRTYSLHSATKSGTEHFTLEIGPTGSFSPLDHPYWTAGPATAFQGAPAAVWRHSDIYNVNTLIDWRRGTLTYRLTTFGTPTKHLTEKQVIRAARSVPPDAHPLPAVSH